MYMIIVELGLECDKSSYLREIIYGNYNDPKYDGIHLIGSHSARHFTYRSVKAISSFITKPYCYQQRRNSRPTYASENRRGQDYHVDCPQARYKRQSVSGVHGGKNSGMSYSDAVKNAESRFSVPTQNYWNPLNL